MELNADDIATNTSMEESFVASFRLIFLPKSKAAQKLGRHIYFILY